MNHIEFCKAPNGLRYLRWGGDGEAVQPEKGSGVENCLGCAQTPQRQVHALLGNLPAYQKAGRKKMILPTCLTFTHNFIFGNSLKYLLEHLRNISFAMIEKTDKRKQLKFEV